MLLEPDCEIAYKTPAIALDIAINPLSTVGI